MVPEPTSAERCRPKLQLTRHRVDARPAPCFDLELICEIPAALSHLVQSNTQHPKSAPAAGLVEDKDSGVATFPLTG
jgi:hypothetical protein